MRSYIIFSILAITLVLASINTTSVAVAFPVITSSFHISLILAGWIISIYQLGITGVMPIAGKLGDVLGKKTTFLICMAFFTLGSLFCAFSPNITLLIFSRFIQSLGGGGIMPAAMGIVADEFPRSKHRAIGFFSSVFPIGQIIGPNLGGILVQNFGWQSIFWINIPACIAVIALAALFMRNEKRKIERIDFLGTAFLFVSLFSLMAALGIIGSGQSARMVAASILLFAAAALLLVALLRHEKKAHNPILNFEVLRGRPFAAANAYNFVYGVAIIGVMSLVPAYAVFVRGMSTLQSGILMTPRSVAMIVASSLTSFYIMRWGYRWPMIAGTCATALGLVLFGIGSGNIAFLYVIIAVIGTGAGLSAPASNNACIELMPQHVSTITGIRGMFRQIGGALSIAVATIILHTSGSMLQGFRIIFFGMAAMLIGVMPAIFMMPRSPRVAPRRGLPRVAKSGIDLDVED
jgi:EmrB/QacA subfamily drug resistance transporter